MKQHPATHILNNPILHPLLIALYPALSLWLANFDQIKAVDVIRPLMFSLGVGLAAFLTGLGIYRGIKKAALFTSLVGILFFTYGHLFELIDMKTVFGIVVGRHRYLIPAWLALFGLGATMLWHARQALSSVTRILNVASLFLLVLSISELTVKEITNLAAVPAAAVAVKPEQAATNSPDFQRRDIYLIIMDAYARQDVLASQHQLDNSTFVQQLRDLGFVVMDCAQSNYGYTPLSIGSLLNMNYMDGLGVSLDPNVKDLNFWDFKELLSHSLVRQKFEALGYRTATFKPLYPWMDAPDSDIYLDVEKSTSFFDKQSSINFHYLFLRTTAFRVVLEVEEHSPDIFNRMPPWLVQIFNPRASLLSSRNLKQYEQNLYSLDILANAAGIPGPKFFYAHLFITHQPYVFRPNGSLRWPVEHKIEAYNDQVLFSNPHLIEIMDRLIHESAVPPVIILQSDHGYAENEDRMKILNAYYLPDGGAQRLYPTITPVNTFRLIFSYYFNQDLPMLEDHSFFSPIDRPGQIEEIPIACPEEN